ncbi:OmpH family outer membrane protein [Myroides marinus]|uniref:OmpH family outer membrane protein n=1 Tax=Myroides marinus TaxID=703342 RepID=UPI002577F65A|nr:OmpH family outer membrane protein [Myroides marinus]MDM1380168.1 OmpH family outer membrane protein [Myroides marinus]MDM1387474.1 OmpH family outer membrane protein [Myroides marinus]MDM1394686.1 OmpH family outer membrane protein [Myroides marinus]
MKKTILMLGLAGLLFSCNGNSDANAAAEFKTAYVDSAKLMKEYEEMKDMESKYKIQSEEKSKSLEAEVAKFQQEVQYFQANARQKGQAWAEQTAAGLQKKEQELQFKQQSLMQSLQKDSGEEMEAVVKKVKEHIADYAKKNKLDYVFNTEDASTVIYGKEGTDITELMLKELNAKYKGSATPAKLEETKPAEKTEDKK